VRAERSFPRANVQFARHLPTIRKGESRHIPEAPFRILYADVEDVWLANRKANTYSSDFGPIFPICEPLADGALVDHGRSVSVG
jgi:hypothetical protein